MTEYRLSLTRTPPTPQPVAGLTALWHFDGASTSPHAITPALTPADLAEHRWYLEEYLVLPGAGDHARARAFEQRLDTFGQELYVALRHEGVDVLRDLVREPGPRLLTLTSKDPETLSIPWELLRDGKGPLALQDVIVRRQLPVASAAKPTPIPALPLRILLVIARPTDAGQIDARSSAGPMMDALDQLGGRVHVELCDPPTLVELERRLGAARDRGDRFHVVHFDGHGVYLRDRGVGALCFEKADRDATQELVPGGDLGDLLARMEVPLALLEACQTADVSSASVFGSVAPALLQAGVGSVIAFSHAVTVVGARILVKRFYEEMCKGKSVGASLNAGRAALKADRVRVRAKRGDLLLTDWHMAQLYQAGPDPVLVPVGAAAGDEGGESAPLQRGRGPAAELGVEPMYGFHGRAAELLKLQRKLREHGAVVLQGGGGMGKTSLAREAARWWHRIGLRRGGAVFFSFESRQGADRAVTGFVQYMEGDEFAPGSPEALWSRAVRYFREREVLWVWDNFESTLAQYQRGSDEGSVVFGDEERDRLLRLYGELTRKGARGWLVVTCRPDETGLGRIAEMALGGLDRTDALEMAREILSLKDVKIGDDGYDREAIEGLLKAVDHHPLSIELVMAHAKVVKPADAAKDLRKVVAAASQVSGEDRNTSLLASLRWSTGRLSEEAQRVLPCLAWFDGGAFEWVLERVCDVGPEVWGRVREELLATALVRVEDGTLFADRPHLRFHPTLAHVAEPGAVSDEEKSWKRFLGAYCSLMLSVDRALRGAESAYAMQVMLREEGNLRRAMALAFERAEHGAGAGLAYAIGIYLEMAGRVRDQARLAGWVQEQMVEVSGPDKWPSERQHAWGLCIAGNAQEALDILRHQLVRIRTAGGDVWHEADCQYWQGRILLHAGQPQQALEPLAAAIRGFEATGDRTNLAAALGGEANALILLRRPVEALASAERSAAVTHECGDARNEGAGLARVAEILMDQRRYDEAEQRYEAALAAARRAGDEGSERSILQHLGVLASEQGRHALAVTRYKVVLARYQTADDREGEMQTADLLGTAERALGHHDAARAWYAETERLARHLGDDWQLGATAYNVGLLLKEQAMALPDDAKAERHRLFSEAAASVATSRAINQKRGDEEGLAASLHQLGVIHRHLGNLEEAERHAPAWQDDGG